MLQRYTKTNMFGPLLMSRVNIGINNQQLKPQEQTHK